MKNFTNRSKIEKLTKLAEGNESIIYEYDADRVIKVFKSNVDLSAKEAKVNYLISIKDKLPESVICPEEVVTLRRKFVGYIMKKMPNCENLSVLTNPKYLTAAQLSNKDVLQIIVNISKDLDKVHAMGIIVGDMSPYNFYIIGKSNYFIGTDNWGIEDKYEPSSYTELFACPDENTHFSIENEEYGFAILAFNMLTGIHPFGGTYIRNENLSILEKMRKGISVLGLYNNDIKVSNIVNGWNWMSSELLKDFAKIFENRDKINLTSDLQELLANMSYCQIDDIYYFGKCPLCKREVNIDNVQDESNIFQKKSQIAVAFDKSDCVCLLSKLHYLNLSNEAVHFKSKRRFLMERGKKVYFSKDGRIAFLVDDFQISIFNEKDQVIADVQRMHKSCYRIKDNAIYYVDTNNSLIRLSVTKNGMTSKSMGYVYNPIFEVSCDGKIFAVSMYPKTAVITIPERTFELNYTGKIREYVIKYDKVSQKWLFVYKRFDGKYCTMLFTKNGIEYDSTDITYNALLNHIEFYNGSVFDMADGKVIVIDVMKNVEKQIECSVVNEFSKLQPLKSGLRIFGKRKIYNYS